MVLGSARFSNLQEELLLKQLSFLFSSGTTLTSSDAGAIRVWLGPEVGSEFLKSLLASPFNLKIILEFRIFEFSNSEASLYLLIPSAYLPFISIPASDLSQVPESESF